MELNFNEIRELLTILNQSNIAEISLKSNDFELTLRKEGKTNDYPSARGAIDIEPPTLPMTAQVALPSAPPLTAPSPPPPAPLASERLAEVNSPIVGTFYSSPGPDEPPFVAVGDRIRSGQAVCIIEAMKIMNEIEAEVTGEVVEILVHNGESVEYGQVLMRVNPG